MLNSALRGTFFKREKLATYASPADPDEPGAHEADHCDGDCHTRNEYKFAFDLSKCFSTAGL